MLRFEVDDLSGAPARALIAQHLREMHAISPPESVHAFDVDKLRQPGVTFWSVWSGDQLAGCGALKRLDAERGEIKSMRVADAFRGTGVGRAILAWITEQARALGIRSLWLETGSTPEFVPALRLYESAGFRRCGPFDGYVEDPFSIFMTRALDAAGASVRAAATVVARSGLRVARATPADARAVEQILDAAAEWQRSRGIAQWTPGTFAGEVQQTIESGELYVARRDDDTGGDDVVGCFMLDPNDPPSYVDHLSASGRTVTPGALLARLAVARADAGRGTGAELIEAACAIAAAAGRVCVRLECPADNARLVQFYVDVGFRRAGELHTTGPQGQRWVAALLERAC